MERIEQLMRVQDALLTKYTHDKHIINLIEEITLEIALLIQNLTQGN